VTDLPAWLCPAPPPQASAREVKLLDPIPPDSEPLGLKAYRHSKREEHLARIAAMGLTETEYIRRQKAASAKKRRAKRATKTRIQARKDWWHDFLESK
jgi:hypothetical protein